MELRKPTAPKASQHALFDMSPCVFANAKIEKRCSFAIVTKAENCVFYSSRMERFRETANPSVGRKLFFCAGNIRHFFSTIVPPLFQPEKGKRPGFRHNINHSLFSVKRRRNCDFAVADIVPLFPLRIQHSHFAVNKTSEPFYQIVSRIVIQRSGLRYLKMERHFLSG